MRGVSEAPLPLREREGPAAKRWEGEGISERRGVRVPKRLAFPHPPKPSAWAPPSPEMGEG
jgi:hypothetical protein